jgi:hypothetical protein
MFHVEHMKLAHFLLFFTVLTSFFVAGCNKADPHPEKSDSIYTDLKNELDIAQKNLESETKQLDGLRKDLANVVPQSGQIKGAQKKVFESENTLELYKQQLKYFEVKMALREHYVRQRYHESLNGGRPWPDLKETEDYKIRMKLQRDKLNWGKPKEKEPEMKKDVPRGTESAPQGSAPGH